MSAANTDCTGSRTTSVVLVGVGGQGILLGSEVTARAAMLAGHDVKTNEVHGMAQRGGSVISQIRYGRQVHSPLVGLGTAIALGSFEQVEALRYSQYLAPGGVAVVSSQKIVPVTVSIGLAAYPEDTEGRLRKVFPRLVMLEAGDIALGLGNIRAANVVVLGALSCGLDLPVEAWLGAIAGSVAERHRDLNVKAFQAGRGAWHE